MTEQGHVTAAGSEVNSHSLTLTFHVDLEAGAGDGVGALAVAGDALEVGLVAANLDGLDAQHRAVRHRQDHVARAERRNNTRTMQQNDRLANA